MMEMSRISTVSSNHGNHGNHVHSKPDLNEDNQKSTKKTGKSDEASNKKSSRAADNGDCGADRCDGDGKTKHAGDHKGHGGGHAGHAGGHTGHGGSGHAAGGHAAGGHAAGGHAAGGHTGVDNGDCSADGCDGDGHAEHGGGDMGHAHGDMGMGSHADYHATLFEDLDTIKNNLGFDVQAELNDLYDSLEGSSISGGPGSTGRENRDKYNEGIKSIMGDLFAEIDQEISQSGSYDQLSPEMQDTLGAVSNWIQLGLHAGTNNDMGTMTHSLESSNKGMEGAAFVIAHGMQAGDDTKMDELFRDGREINQNAMGALDGAGLFDLMKDNNGLTGLYQGKDGSTSTFWGASADVDANATQNPAAAIDYFKNDY